MLAARGLASLFTRSVTGPALRSVGSDIPRGVASIPANNNRNTSSGTNVDPATNNRESSNLKYPKADKHHQAQKYFESLYWKKAPVEPSRLEVNKKEN